MINVPTPHIGAKAGDVAQKVLMPGDPLRAKFIAENYLTDIVCYNEIRNMLGYTGLSDELLKKYIRDSASLWEGYVDQLPCAVVGSVVGTHAGPGAVAVAFFARDSE